MGDPYNLRRFVEAQQSVYDQVCAELRQGRKSGHWMWFIFPQIKGLGVSDVANWYAITSLLEAQSYLAHPVLGSRLIECAALAAEVNDGSTARQVFGFPDDLKFRSSMTLFAQAAPGNEVIQHALDRYFDGEHDPLTLELLSFPGMLQTG